MYCSYIALFKHQSGTFHWPLTHTHMGAAAM